MTKVTMTLKLDVELEVDEDLVLGGDGKPYPDTLKNYLDLEILPDALEFRHDGGWNSEITDTYYGEARIEKYTEEKG